MEQDNPDDTPLGTREATCAFCSATFLVQLTRACDAPVSLVYEGKCGQCEGTAELKYVAAKKVDE